MVSVRNVHDSIVLPTCCKLTFKHEVMYILFFFFFLFFFSTLFSSEEVVRKHSFSSNIILHATPKKDAVTFYETFSIYEPDVALY